MANKPLILIIDDLYDNIIQLINESKLPPSQLEPIIQNILNQTVSAREREKIEAKRQYEASLAQQNQEQEENINKENA